MARTSLGPGSGGAPSSSSSRPRSAPAAINTWKDLGKYDPKLYDRIMRAAPILKRTRFRPFQPTFPRWSMASVAPRPSASASAPRPSASSSVPRPSRGKVYECQYCDRDYGSSKDRDAHEEDKHYVCHYCGKRRRDRREQEACEAKCKKQRR